MRASASHWIGAAQRLAFGASGSREALRRYQDARLRALIQHVWDEVPFYRERLARAGLQPGDVRGLEDLSSLPFVDKDELRSAPIRDRVANGIEPDALVVRRTSGSTGRPFTIRRTRAEDRLLYLFRLRARRQYGVRWRDRTVSLGEPPIGGHQRDRLGSARHAAGLFRRDVISCFLPTDEILRELAALAPDVLSGYPAALARVARAAATEGHPRLRPRVVHTGGEPLLPQLRRTIAEGFGAAVYDVYGAHEFDLLAWECPEGGRLHVCDDNLILEVLRDGQPAQEGERGEVVATGLHCHAMPFIRYRMHDVVTRGPTPCPCGQPFSTILEVQGRTADYFRLAGLGLVHPFEITGQILSGDTTWIDQYQLAQITPDRVVLRVALSGDPPGGALERIEGIGRRVLGSAARFDVELVEGFAPEPTGKFRPYLGLEPSG